MKRYGIIYKITNNINNKVYIGQTVKTFEMRYANDIAKWTHNRHLKNSINKYGIENFKIEKEFDIAYSKEELEKKEQYYIKLYNSCNPDYGYNKTTGGRRGKLNAEIRNKISNTMKGKYNCSNHPRARSVVCLNDGNIFNTGKECSEFYNVNHSNLVAHLNGRRKSCGGMNFKYYDKLNQVA